MARVLAISSMVVRGAVGLSAAVPALRALGHEVWPLPTVLLSNHPGHLAQGKAMARVPIEAGKIGEILAALDANGWLPEVDGVLTGYLPSEAHVEAAVEAIGRVRRANPAARVLVDPILGDEDTKLYIDRKAAEAIRDRLAALADILTPNRFELGFLVSKTITNEASVKFGARQFGSRTVLVTSAWIDGAQLASLLLGPIGAVTQSVPFRPGVPRGTGDLLAARYLGRILNDNEPEAAFKGAIEDVDDTLALSAGRDELDLTALPGNRGGMTPGTSGAKAP